MPLNLVDEINMRVKFYIDNVTMARRIQKEHLITKLVTWNPSTENWITLNIDGVVKNNSKAGCGGILKITRDTDMEASLLTWKRVQ